MESGSSKAVGSKLGGSLGGRPTHNYWIEGRFERKLSEDDKWVAVCMECKQILKNTSESRLKTHRNKCPINNFIGGIKDIENEIDENISPNITIYQSKKRKVRSGSLSTTPENNHVNKDNQLKLINKKQLINKKGKYVPFYDTIAADESNSIDKFLGCFIFGWNLPVDILNSSLFKNFCKQMRPSYQLPNTEKLSSIILNQIHDELNTGKLSIQNADGILLLSQCKKSSGENIITGFIRANTKNFFVKSWKDLNQNNEEELMEIINDAIKIIKDKYNVTVYCAITTTELELSYNDIENVWLIRCSTKMAKLALKEFVDRQLTIDAESLLNEFQSTEFQLELNNQRVQKHKDLSQKVPDEFRSLYICLKDLPVMRKLVVKGKVKLIANKYVLLFDEEFEKKLENSLPPIIILNDIIKKNNSLSFSLADATEYWLDFQLSLRNYPSGHSLNITTNPGLLGHPIALAANFLHPLYKGQKFDDVNHEYYSNMYDYLISQLDEELLLEELMQYKMEKGFFSTLIKKVRDNNMNWINFWQYAHCKYPLLAEYAIKLLQVPASVLNVDISDISKNNFNDEAFDKLIDVISYLRLSDKN